MVNNLEKYILRTSIFKYSVLSTFKTSLRLDRTQKASRRTKLRSTFYNAHPAQKCHVNVIRDTVMYHENNIGSFYFILP